MDSDLIGAKMKNDIIIVRGGGDLATGIIQKLWRSGFKVLVLETEKPMAIRTTVALCTAVYTEKTTVEDMTAVKISTNLDVETAWENGEIPILCDPKGESIKELKPLMVVDAILAKKNLGTNLDMAPIVVGLGPGFTAGEDVHAVIETMRGHDLARLILKGSAQPNTGIPGEIGGHSTKRVLHSPCNGTVKSSVKIGDIVQVGETVLKVDDTELKAPFTGLVRGMIPNGFKVKECMKIGDIDPRTDVDVYTISDKARALGGAVLEALFYLKNKM